MDSSARPALGIAAAEDPLVCAAIVAQEIRRLLREDTVRDKHTGVRRRAGPGDIAVLFRSRTSHREFEHELENLGIPTYVYKGLGFFDADEIKDLSALIRFLANPSSDLRAAAFLRSRFIRLSDEALAALAPRLSAALVESDPPGGLSQLRDDDRQALEQARDGVRGWLSQVDRVPPADLIEHILPETAFAYELRGPRAAQAWENVKKMRGLIRRIQNRGYATLARIADHLDSLTAGDESNAVLEAQDAVNLMTVHAAKGLEFPVVFVVNLAKGASGPPKPVRVSGENVSIGPFVSETDEEERAREREETKRLLYVALTRARDRLYLASFTKNGAFVPGRGSLGEVLPDSIRGLFGDAAASTSENTIPWSAQSTRRFEFHRCVAVPTGEAPAVEALPTIDSEVGDLAEVLESPARSAISGVTAGDSPQRSSLDMRDALVGTLVHRLFQKSAAIQEDAALDEIVDMARALLRPDEIAIAGGAGAVARRAAEIWLAMRQRDDVRRLLSAGQRIHEVPFSMCDPARPGGVLRGSIDCLLRHADGIITVVEFKSGRPRSEHQVQLDLYVSAARSLFPGTTVTGVLVYPQ